LLTALVDIARPVEIQSDSDIEALFGPGTQHRIHEVSVHSPTIF
jgi:hypothetical protein